MSEPSTLQRSFWIRTLVCLTCLLALYLVVVHSAEPRPAARPTPVNAPRPPIHDSRSQLPLEAGVPLGVADSNGASVPDARLLGFWEHRSSSGIVTLEFLSEDQLVFAGRRLHYKLTADTLLVADDAGGVEYVYRVDGNKLELEFPGDNRRDRHLTFQRVSTSPADPD